MTGAERPVAIRAGSLYQVADACDYPGLLEAGRRLADGGLTFHDLTRLFLDDRDPICIDSYCHMDLLGIQLTKYIARTILEALPSALLAPRLSVPRVPPGVGQTLLPRW